MINFKVKYRIDDIECEATVVYNNKSKHFTAASFPILTAKVNKYIAEKLDKAGVNIGDF